MVRAQDEPPPAPAPESEPALPPAAEPAKPDNTKGGPGRGPNANDPRPYDRVITKEAKT